jgi:hypothetical protein
MMYGVHSSESLSILRERWYHKLAAEPDAQVHERPADLLRRKSMEETSQLIFRISLWRPWLLAITLLAPLPALGVIVSVVAGSLAAAASVLLGFAAIAVVLLLPIGLSVSASRWHVSAAGIGGRNNALVYHRLSWSEIESVEPWLIPGYRYLQVNGRGKRHAFWLPLFLTDMPSFRSAVARSAPPTNPLRRYLETH